MIRRLLPLTALLTPLKAFAQSSSRSSAASAASVRPIDLLEPIGSVTQVTIGNNPLEVLNQYLQPFMPVLIGSAAGLAILMIIFGGFEIMLSGGNMAQSKGKERIIAALGGLLLLVFSATILYMLNANYFLLSR